MAKQLYAVRQGVVDILERPLERSLEPHQVRVRSMFSLISQGTETTTIQGKTASFSRSWDRKLRLFHENPSAVKTFPVSLGYSCVGEVEQVGNAVTKINVGDVVWLDQAHSDEHVVSEDEASLGLCRNDVDPRRYTFRVLAKVALMGVHDAHPYLGSTAVVVGLGVVGQLTVDFLRLAGATQIFGIDLSSGRRKVAEARNCITIDPSNCDPAEKIKLLSEGADFAIETSSTQSGLRTAMRSVKVGGKVVTISTYPTGGTTLELGEEYHRNRIEVVSSMSVNDCPHRGAPIWTISRLVEATRSFLDSGAVQPEKLITRTVHFKDVPDFYSSMLGNFSDVATIIRY